MTRSLVLLSGEGSTIPEAEAKALFMTSDPESKFYSPEPRVVIAETQADPVSVARRVAFSRRVGLLFEEPSTIAESVKGKSIRVRRFHLGDGDRPERFDLLDGLSVRIDLENPDFEVTHVSGQREYFALTRPSEMRQSWALRRPRRRAFFHPSAIFPKLSRALVNLTMCKEGSVLFDPFCGTGSIPMEAAEVGMRVVAMDRAAVMARGSLANMRFFGQSWAGVIRGEASSPPIREVDGIATDVPYGRAASTEGRNAEEVMSIATEVLPRVMRSGATMVLMHPEDGPVKSGGGLKVLGEHRLYVHKRLTRIITILRKN